jgi:hypothetical protein
LAPDGAVSIRDTPATRLERRLARLDTRHQAREALSVRTELIADADGLRQRLAWWRDLQVAADPSNPALDPESVLPHLSGVQSAAMPRFLFLWRDGAGESAVRDRRLIALVPIVRHSFAGLRLPWHSSWSPPWWPVATPLLHRRHQRAAARAIRGWLAARPTPTSALVLRDLPRDGDFAATLLADRHASRRHRDRSQPVLPLRSDAGTADTPPAAGLALRSGRELGSADLDRALSLASLWAGTIADNGIIASGELSTERYRHLAAMAAQGRLILVEALHRERTDALTLALRTGTTASVILLAASPRLPSHARDMVTRDAFDGLIAFLSREARMSCIEASADAGDMPARLLAERRGLVDVVLPASSLVKGAMAAARLLRPRRTGRGKAGAA